MERKVRKGLRRRLKKVVEKGRRFYIHSDFGVEDKETEMDGEGLQEYIGMTQGQGRDIRAERCTVWTF